MYLYGRMGACSNGYYKDFDGLLDLQSCFEQCQAEYLCMYVSFMEGTCKGYGKIDCKLDLTDKNAKFHRTYQKIQKGKRGR